ncbi:hypothetical protein CPB85DRAFT_1258410 [Mucidula mucida]|nr:hypothetical protein CPB85DRAFT_1258410 [Mucidula mucida]
MPHKVVLVNMIFRCTRPSPNSYVVDGGTEIHERAISVTTDLSVEVVNPRYPIATHGAKVLEVWVVPVSERSSIAKRRRPPRHIARVTTLSLNDLNNAVNYQECEQRASGKNHVKLARSPFVAHYRPAHRYVNILAICVAGPGSLRSRRIERATKQRLSSTRIVNRKHDQALNSWRARLSTKDKDFWEDPAAARAGIRNNVPLAEPSRNGVLPHDIVCPLEPAHAECPRQYVLYVEEAPMVYLKNRFTGDPQGMVERVAPEL